MSPIDPRTRENPEAAMVHAELTPAQLADCLKNPYTKHQDLRVHQPSAAFFDLPWPWPKSEPTEREILRFIANSALEHNALYRRIVEQNATPDAVPGFDSEAHRAFLRSLG